MFVQNRVPLKNQLPSERSFSGPYSLMTQLARNRAELWKPALCQSKKKPTRHNTRHSHFLKAVRLLVLLWLKASLSVHGEERTNLNMVTLATTLTWQEVPDNPNALGCIPVYFDSAPAQRCSKLAMPGGSWPAGPLRGIIETALKQLLACKLK